jgi:sporadic carbohydrate cluster protein (TIGR04323 family)
MMKIRGYAFSGKISGQIISQRVQNIIIREYCNRLGVQYLLSATEYNFPNSIRILNSVMQEYDRGDIDGICFYSLDQLPSKKSEMINFLSFCENKKLCLLFASEGWQIIDSKDYEKIKEIMVIKSIAAKVHGGDFYKK